MPAIPASQTLDETRNPNPGDQKDFFQWKDASNSVVGWIDYLGTYYSSSGPGTLLSNLDQGTF